MAKLVCLDPKYYPRDDYGFWCPGCQQMHEVAVEKTNSSNAQWTFNGDPIKPTFSPSLVIHVNPPGPHYNAHAASSRCHSFVRDGKIEFLGDCTHALKGQTVDLPDFPDHVAIAFKRL